MATGYSGIKLACLVLVSVVVLIGSPRARASLTCGQVVRSLTPCASYVAYGGSIPMECCNGVRALYNAAQATPDRQQVCTCLKQAIDGIPYTGFNIGNAANIPRNCGVKLPYKIDPSVDCSKVK